MDIKCQQTSYIRDRIFIADTKPTGIITANILQLHGFPGTGKNYDLAEALALKGYRVVVPHYQGTGQSRQGSFSFNETLKQMAVLASHLKQETPNKPLYFLGYSWGGLISLINHHIADRLILLAPLCYLPGAGPRPAKFHESVDAYYDSPSTIARFFRSFSEGVLSHTEADLEQEFQQLAVKLLEAKEQLKNNPKISIIHGDNDLLIPHTYSQDLLQQLGGGSLTLMKEQNHLFSHKRFDFIDSVTEVVTTTA